MNGRARGARWLTCLFAGGLACATLLPGSASAEDSPPVTGPAPGCFTLDVPSVLLGVAYQGGNVLGGALPGTNLNGWQVSMATARQFGTPGHPPPMSVDFSTGRAGVGYVSSPLPLNPVGYGLEQITFTRGGCEATMYLTFYGDSFTQGSPVEVWWKIGEQGLWTQGSGPAEQPGTTTLTPQQFRSALR